MLLSVDRSDATRPRSLSFEIVTAVAEREGVDPVEIEPPEYDALYDVLNPEALDALFAPLQDGTERAGGRVQFTYCGYDITVTSDREIIVDD